MSLQEQRQQHRYTIGIHTEVYRKSYNEEPIFTCKVRNIGLEGLKLPNKDLTLRIGSRLHLLLVTSGVKGREEFRMDAKVVWKTAKDLGLSLYPLSSDEQSALNKFLFIAKVALRSRERARLS